ncbi:peptidoglycan DD-metalloendopeptidase family protein [Candidatus Neomarinimicrobiota bacterium]
MRYILPIFVFILLKCSGPNVEIVDHFENIYGISSDSLNVEKYSIDNGQNLSDILSEHGMDYPTIDQISLKSQDIYDVRKMRAGNPYFMLSSADSLRTLKYLVYERNPIEFVVFSLTDSLNIYLQSKTITVDTAQTTGIIDGSLWVTMLENNDDPNLAIELSEIYAWTIDFFGLYKNDSYKIVYEKMYADTQYVGIGKIIAVSFNHLNNDYYAFSYKQDGIIDYFDEKGGSLRRAFLKAPLRFSRISSRFSYNRKHPVLKIRRPHLGVDYVASVGTPVLSVGDGVVVNVGRRAQEGRMVQIKHNGTYSTQYLHLSRYGTGIRTGARVMQGQIIGYVGNSGLSTGAHLDFRFYKNGQAIDPLKVKSPPVNPVNPNNLEPFLESMHKWKAHLDSISFPSTDSAAVSKSL